MKNQGYEPLSLKMCIRSAKTYDFCVFVCFAFMYALLSHLHKCMLPSDIKLAHRQNIRKQSSISNVARYVSYVKSETSDIWRTGAWFLKPFGERVEEKHIYHLAKPNSAVKTGTVYRGCNVIYEVFWKMEKSTLRGELET